jgi:hypothetical protein
MRLHAREGGGVPVEQRWPDGADRVETLGDRRAHQVPGMDALRALAA